MTTTLGALTPETTVNKLLELAPEAVELLNDLGIDSCCGGSLSLQEAAQDADTDFDTVLSKLRDRFSE